MKTMRSSTWIRVTAIIAWLALWPAAIPAKEVFQTPNNGHNLGVWRITREPAVRHWANYHNTQCWSPDGRYLCYTRYAPHEGRYSDAADEIHLYDLLANQDRLVERGFNPRWAKSRNWLFYVRITGTGRGKASRLVEVRWLDLDTGGTKTLATGVEALGETTHDDRWLLGSKRFRGQTPEFVTVRIALPGGAVEELREAVGSQWMPNPRHPVFFTRQDHKSEPFGATRWFYDLDGRNQRIAVPTLQQCHMSWIGSGEFLLLGNGLVRGRRWNEPFPSNVHILASIGVGDISPCGRSGRYVCGDHNVADLRSGDGFHFIEPLSIICYPATVKDDSGIYDADPKGSPDGTKICFVSNYDLKDGLLTYIERVSKADRDVLRVRSTDGFPDKGAVVLRREIVGYERKTKTTFEGLTRCLHDTLQVQPSPGMPVTSFKARCLTDAQWRQIPGVSPPMRHSIGEEHPVLLRQRQTDVYVAVVRKPDRPHLRMAGSAAQLIPGEEHYETAGYHLLRDGRKITARPILTGMSVELQPGEHRAVAVEWSGLESEPSPPLRVAASAKLQVLADPPKDFSWTSDRWLEGRSVREIVHLHDGVIHREWYRGNILTRRHDLNADGKAIRRLAIENGKLAQREYHDRDGKLLNREIFDAEGFITESIRYGEDSGKPFEAIHWWFEHGTPVRQTSKDGEFVKQGDQWAATKPSERAEKKRKRAR
ncbi:MAG: PD40 domain-containing protein [Verrucomicrobia bacterium]|nr:PD40 domain-containing protein [Verrucomicrobiota bacterium]